MLTKTNNAKGNFVDNGFHTNLRFFVSPNFPFTASETMRDYYLQTRYIQVASRATKWLKTQGVRKSGNIRKVSKPHKMIE